VSTTTVDGSVATAASTTQVLSNPGVARTELTAPQRLAAVIAPEAARMRGTVAHRTLEIRLDPPDLGTVDLEIRSSGSTVTIVARTESAEAMLAVLRQRDSIEASLREHGMDLSGFDVSDGTPEREQAENRRGPAAAGVGSGSTAETDDVETTLSPTNPEGSVFL
jgi:flagellar hook-length control protein FliK